MDLATFPRWAQDWSAEQVEATVTYLGDLSLTELRRRQDIHAAQIDAANEQRNHDARWSEQLKLSMTTDAVSRMTWGEPQPGLHSQREAFRSGDPGKVGAP